MLKTWYVIVFSSPQLCTFTAYNAIYRPQRNNVQWYNFYSTMVNLIKHTPLWACKALLSVMISHPMPSGCLMFREAAILCAGTEATVCDWQLRCLILSLGECKPSFISIYRPVQNDRHFEHFMADLKIAYVIDFVASLAFYLHIIDPGYVCHFYWLQ